MSDVLERLRAADPVASEPDAPPVEWMLARVDAAATPPAAASPRRSHRRALLAGVAAATGLAAAGVLASTWSSPDVVAEASEALGARGAIIHTVTVEQPLDANGRTAGPQKIIFSRKPRREGYRAQQFERWVAQDPVRERTRSTIEPADGGAPGVQEVTFADGVLRWKASWLGDKVRTFRLPQRSRNRTTIVNPMMPGPDPVAGIRKMLAGKQLESAGQVAVAGRRALSLRGEIPAQKLKSGYVSPTQRIEYLVDPDTFEPIRIDLRIYELRNGKEVSTDGYRVTFKTYERLPLTASNLALLKLPR